jgi:hypothetical protein
MIIKANQIVTMNEAKQDFAKAATLVDLSKESLLELTDGEKIDIVARRILEQHRKAFEELGR